MRSAVGKPAFLVGIDLGTTNTVVAYADANDAQAGIQLFAIEQLLAPGEVGARPLLPSLRYHPAAGELAAGDLQLPWPKQDVEHPVLGALARQLGAQVPGRLVSSAKSWLSHANVDRQAPILPWAPMPTWPRCRPWRPAPATSRMCAPPGITASRRRRSKSRNWC